MPKNDNTDLLENNPNKLRQNALKVLALAKQQEAEKLAMGYGYVSFGKKTRVLMKLNEGNGE